MIQLDLAHAAVTALLIFITVWALKRWDGEDAPHRRWDWRIFVAVFAIMSLLNIVWPYQH